MLMIRNDEPPSFPKPCWAVAEGPLQPGHLQPRRDVIQRPQCHRLNAVSQWPPAVLCSKFQSRGFQSGSVVKNPPASTGDMDLILGFGRSPGEGNGNPLQYPCLGNPMDREAWRAVVLGVTKET